MEQTLKQVGDLLLGAVPTILLLLMLYGFYTALVYRPLKKILAERRSRTDGIQSRAGHSKLIRAKAVRKSELRFRVWGSCRFSAPRTKTCPLGPRFCCWAARRLRGVCRCWW